MSPLKAVVGIEVSVEGVEVSDEARVGELAELLGEVGAAYGAELVGYVKRSDVVVGMLDEQ